MATDRSNGWEAVARRFVAERSSIGAATVRAWCRTLPAGASVLDLGCGSGVPIAGALIAEGCRVSGVDASSSMVAAFHSRFPQVPVACAPVEDSSCFDSTYDAILAIGLLFLLPEDGQRELIQRVSTALQPEGRFLFTAPVQAVSWTDTMMGGHCVSLGDSAYRRALADAGLTVIGEYSDEGGNHYYDACRMEPDIASLEEQLREAMLASDVASLEALISPDLVFVNHFGAVLSRQEDLELHRSGALRFHRIDPSERRILMLEHAVFVCVRVHLSGVFNGSPFQDDLQFSRLWQRTISGAWQVVAGQATRVQALPEPSS